MPLGTFDDERDDDAETTRRAPAQRAGFTIERFEQGTVDGPNFCATLEGAEFLLSLLAQARRPKVDKPVPEVPAPPRPA